MLHPIAPFVLLLSSQGAPKPSSEGITFAGEQAGVAMALYRTLDEKPGNVVFSPFSISRALSMVREGAAGETAQELERALRLSKDSGVRFAELMRVLEPAQVGIDGTAHPVYSLALAASMWGQSGAPIREDFKRVLQRDYAAELFPTDFGRPDAAREAINTWASTNTRGRVPEIIPVGVLTPQTRLVLVDTVYFLASWQDAFRESETKLERFTPTNGEAVEAPTMHRIGNLRYAETELAQVLELPYERGATSLVVVLPKRGQALDLVCTREEISAWTGALASRRVDVALPKFRFTFGRELAPVLQRLGVHRAFRQAEFPGILDEPCSIAAVLHQAFIAVDEKGTEAAAATAISIRVTAARDNETKPIAFHADRPFLFFVRHTQTGAVLFLGRTEDPTR